MADRLIDPRARNALLVRLSSVASGIKQTDSIAPVDGVSWGLPPERYFLAGDQLTDLNRVSAEFAKRRYWNERFSEEYIRGRFLNIAFGIRVHGKPEGEAALQSLVDELSAFDSVVTVCVPLEGLTVLQGSLELNGAVIVGNDESGREYVADRIASTTCSALGDAHLVEWNDHFKSRSQNSAWIVVEVMAEPVLAVLRATAAARRIVEVVSFVASTDRELGYLRNSAASVAGELPGGRRSVTHFSKSGLVWDATNIGPHLVEFSSRTASQLEQIGALGLVDAQKSDQEFSDFERAVLNAIHWYSTAQVQTDNANALLFHFMALEAMLNVNDHQGSSLSKVIPHHTALLVSRDESERAYVRQFLAEKYSTRSRIAHGQSSTVTRFEVEELRAMVIFLILSVLEMRPVPKSTMELYKAIDHDVRKEVFRAEMSNRIDPLSRQNSLKALRMKKGLTHEELGNLVNMSSVDVEQIEERGRVPRFDQLKNLANALGVDVGAVTLPDRARIVSVEGHRFLLVAEYRGDDTWEPVVLGWDHSTATKWPTRPPLDEFLDVVSPSVFLHGKQGAQFTHRFYTFALNSLEEFIRERLMRSF